MDDKRLRILEAARKRFHYYGVRKTTMQEIARDAGVAVGTLYLYFRDKDDLLVAGTEEYVTRHRRRVEAVIASGASAADKLRRYVLDRFRASKSTRIGSRPHVVELWREVLRVRPERRLEEGQMMIDTFARILRQGLESGELSTDDPERDARVFLLALAFLFPSALDEGVPVPSEDDALLVVNWFLRVWSGDSPSARGSKRVPAARAKRSPRSGTGGSRAKYY